MIDGTHIHLFEKPKTRIIASIVDSYNHKFFITLFYEGYVIMIKNNNNNLTS